MEVEVQSVEPGDKKSLVIGLKEEMEVEEGERKVTHPKIVLLGILTIRRRYSRPSPG